MHHQAVRLVQALDDCILERSIQSGNIDLLLIGIIAGPEEVSGHPVYCQPVGIRKVWEMFESQWKKLGFDLIFRQIHKV